MVDLRGQISWIWGMITYGRRNRKKSVVFKLDSGEHRTEYSARGCPGGQGRAPQGHRQGREVEGSKLATSPSNTEALIYLLTKGASTHKFILRKVYSYTKFENHCARGTSLRALPIPELTAKPIWATKLEKLFPGLFILTKTVLRGKVGNVSFL